MSELEIARLVAEIIGITITVAGGLWWLSRLIWRAIELLDGVNNRLDVLNGSVKRHDAGSVVNGWMVSRNPVTPNRVTIVSGGEMWFLNFTWDVDNNRLTFDFSQPNEGMPYVHHAAPYLGGYLVTGGQTIGVGTLVKFIASNGDVLDFAFPQYHGSKEVRVNSIMTQGAWAILDVINSDNTDRQWWFYNDKKYFPDTILQSLSENEAGTGKSAISATPVAWSTQPIYGPLNTIYTVFPNGVDTAWARQFLPPDLGSDPRITNTTQTRTMAFDASGVENTGLYIETPQWDIGPAEANKTLLTLQYLDRLLDDLTAYGTVEASYSTDGGTSFTSIGVFDNSPSLLEKANIATAGVSYKFLVFRFTLKHTAGSTKSPSGLPWVFETDQQWPLLRHWKFYIDPNTVKPNYNSFIASVRTAMNTKTTAALKVSTTRDVAGSTALGAVATIDPVIEWTSTPKVPPLGVDPKTPFVDGNGRPVLMVLNFSEKPGSVT